MNPKRLPVPEHTRLRDLELAPLSPEAEETRRRLWAFLFGVARRHWAKALLAGYTPSDHSSGVYQARLLEGQQPFGEWRRFRANKPTRDPDMPRHIATLERFVERWAPVAERVVEATEDAQDRSELREILSVEPGPCRTRQAQRAVDRLRWMEKGEFFAPVWRALQAEGFEDALVSFDAVLQQVQEAVYEAPLDDAELAEIAAWRERLASRVRTWLDERRPTFAAFAPADLERLGLGASVPEEIELPVGALAYIEAAGSA